jgi:hypothetical protein
MFILDFGSGNTCKNSKFTIDKMIEQLAYIDQNRRSIIKWQLFLSAGSNTPLSKHSFDYAYRKAEKLGFKTTASVFDKPSLDFLLEFPIPFVKIANRIDLYKLIRLVPKEISVVCSYKDINLISLYSNVHPLCCISDYPADLFDYEETFNPKELIKGISDHTIDWRLYKKYCPENYECHYKLEDSTGLDSGEFARTPYKLKEILK